MSGSTDFTKMVPGFDFLQSLMKGASTSLPAMGQWIAPTLNPEELEKRIGELRTVQFWLEQNARMLGATIQALEVQRMTLSALKTMNLPMAELRKSMEIRPPAAAPEAAAAAAPAEPAAAAPTAAAPGVVDPMQWWGALTQQFTELAKSALKEAPAAAAAATAAATTPAPAADPAADPPAAPRKRRGG